MTRTYIISAGAVAGALIAIWSALEIVAVPAAEKFVDGRLWLAEARLSEKIQKIEKQAIEAEKDLAVIKAQVKATAEDIGEVKGDVRRLTDHLLGDREGRGGR